MIVPPEGLILNIYKPSGMTSFDVVYKIRKKLDVKKVGHAGTLDPLAEGILLILVGKATKQSASLTGLAKSYRAEIILGRETDSYDTDGSLIAERDSSSLETDEIELALQNFRGETEQIPPMYSAVKVDGKKLYELARKGIEIERKARKVNIDKLELIGWNPPHLEIEIDCSKGTFIRSLAHDIGQLLGCGGCIEKLIRTRVGDYTIEESLNLNEFLEY